MLLSFLLVQTVLASPGPAIGIQERPIIEAALRDRRLIESTDGGRFTLILQTMFLGEGSVALFTDGRIQIDGTQDVIRVSDDLIESLQEHNRRRLPLNGIKKAPRTRQSIDRDVGYWRRVSVSRPGVSADGLQALVAIAGENEGHTLYLEKRGGVWSVIGRGGFWVT